MTLKVSQMKIYTNDEPCNVLIIVEHKVAQIMYQIIIK